MERTKMFSRILAVLFLFSFALAPTISAVAPIKTQFSSALPSVSEAASLSGSYRLRLPSIPFRIKNKTLAIQLCNTFKFKLTETDSQNGLRLQPVGSTKKLCLNSDDQLYANLLTSITSYQVRGRTLYFYKGKDILVSATGKSESTNIDDPLSGKWELVIRNLALEVSNEDFSFQGCNTNIFKYQATTDGEISFGAGISTRKACNVDTDALFSSALQKSKTYTTGQVSFVLYGKNGEKTAYATPYVV